MMHGQARLTYTLSNTSTYRSLSVRSQSTLFACSHPTGRFTSRSGLVSSPIQPSPPEAGAVAQYATLLGMWAPTLRGIDLVHDVMQLKAAQDGASLRRGMEVNDFLNALSAVRSGHAAATAAAAAAASASASEQTCVMTVLAVLRRHTSLPLYNPDVSSDKCSWPHASHVHQICADGGSMSEKQPRTASTVMPKQHGCLRSSRLLQPRRLAPRWLVRRKSGMVQP